MSRKQPIVVYKYVNNEIVDTRRFSKTNGEGGALEYLRSQGCRFGSNLFTNLGDDSIEFPINESVRFEAECDAAPSQAVRRRGNGSVCE